MEKILTEIGFSTAASLAVVWASIRFLGKAWIEDQFKRQLEALKFAHAQQIEGLRLELDILRNRISKLYEQEFVVLPEMWNKMSAALGATIAASDPHRLYPSTVGMNEGELNEYLETAPLLAWEKGTIRGFAANEQQARDASLRNMLDWAGFRQAQQLTFEFRDFLHSRRIFISEDLSVELDRCAARLEEAVSEFRTFLEARQANRPISLEICPTLKAESTRMADAVRAEIQRKLFGAPI
jgi:hypothetical protein